MPRNGLPIPASAMQRIPEIRDANRALIAAFESHPSYASQSSSRSGKVYFMWDFATRTNAMFEAILNNDAPATKSSNQSVPTARMSEKQKEESKSDSVGRCMMLWSMIKDTSGKTAVMFGETPGQGLDLGDDVRRASDAISSIVFGDAA